MHDVSTEGVDEHVINVLCFLHTQQILMPVTAHASCANTIGVGTESRHWEKNRCCCYYTFLTLNVSDVPRKLGWPPLGQASYNSQAAQPKI